MYRSTLRHVLSITTLACSLMTGCGPSEVKPRIDPIDHFWRPVAWFTAGSERNVWRKLFCSAAEAGCCHRRVFKPNQCGTVCHQKNDTACELSLSSMRIGTAMTISSTRRLRRWRLGARMRTTERRSKTIR